MAENQEDTSNTESTTEVDPQVEADVKEASGQGWVPKEKFRGDEKDWVDAGVFVKRGREILPILRKNNENLLRELNQTRDQLKEFKQTADEFKKFQKESYERKAGELEQQIIQLKASRAQAITDGDGQRVNAMDDVIDTLKEEHKVAKENAKVETKTDIPSTPTIDPKLQDWLGRNEWFGKDKRLTSMTNAIGESLRMEDPNLQGQAFLDKLDQALAEEFPAKFGKTTEKRTPNFQAESGSGRGKSGNGGKNSYENLPKDAKDACDRYVKQKLLTRDQFVADYDWS